MSCGIVLPAVIKEGNIAWAAASIEEWAGLPLHGLATRRLGMPVVVEFDGYGAALGEWWRGTPAAYDDAAVVIAGTGVGAASSTAAGCIGERARSPVGSAGSVSRVHRRRVGASRICASGPAILAHARRLNSRDRAAYPDTAAVFAAGEGGDLAAQRAIERGMVALASGVGAIVALLAPEIVVLGGSVGARPDTVARVRELAATMTQPFAMQTVKIEGSSLGPLSSLYGAAYFAHQLDQGKEP